MKKVLGLMFGLLLFISQAKSQDEVLTNNSIVDMMELGFTDDVIIGKIETSKSKFDTAVETLKELKAKGISSDVIIAMMHAGKKEADSQANEQSEMSGIYIVVNNEYKKLFPTVFSGTKTNTLGSAFSYGIASSKIKSTLNGEQSNNIVNTNSPEFYFYFNTKNKSDLAAEATNWWFTVASSPNEFVLVKLKTKKNRRELETGKVNIYSGTSIGIDEESTIKFDIDVINDWEFKVTPSLLLEPGEYCFFYQGTIPQGGYNNQSVFDFSIPASCKVEYNYKFKIGDIVWIIRDGKAKSFEVKELKVGKSGAYYCVSSGSKSEYIQEAECYDSKKDLKQALGID